MKKAIAAIINDSHCKEDNIEVNKSIYRQASNIAQELGLNILDHGGDIFNSRKSQSQTVLIAFKEILDDLYSKGIRLMACVGNHDKTSYDSADSFLDPFAEHPAFGLFRTSGGRLLTPEISLQYLSYFSDEIYVEEANKLKGNLHATKNVLLTHIGISGATMNNGVVIESENITPTLFKEWDLTLVAHYHDAQVLAEGRIKYMGAVIQHNFGELTDKGLTILYDDLSTEIIPLKYPQYIKYEISPKDLTSKDIADLTKEKEESGDNIRIVLTGTEAEIKSFNKQLLIEAGVSVQNKCEDLSIEELEQRVEAFDAGSLKKEFESFCEKNKLDLQTGMKYFTKILAA